MFIIREGVGKGAKAVDPRSSPKNHMVEEWLL